MTPSEKQFKLSELARKMEMLEDERRALEATPVTTQVWEPGEKQFYNVTFAEEPYKNNSRYDKNLISLGLAHPTKEAAERHHSFLVMLHDLHKFAVEHNEGWKPDWADTTQTKAAIYYNLDRSQLNTAVYHASITTALPVFKNERLAQKVIDTFGDRLKILFEYYNS